jgi:hypothetical protein
MATGSELVAFETALARLLRMRAEIVSQARRTSPP